MRFARLIFVATAMTLLVAACSDASKLNSTAGKVAGETSKPGAFLAYEHAVYIRAPAEAISERLNAVRGACVDSRFGACSVLRVDESTGEFRNDSIMLRVVPTGVEPLVALAKQGGSIGARETKAEDRADAVADIARRTQLLIKQREKLSEYETRKDLSVGDRLVLVRELASIEQQLEELANAAKNENRRVETNLVTLNFRSLRDVSHWKKVGGAFTGFFDQFSDGVAQFVELIGYGLPFLLVAFPLALLWRWLWRRIINKR